MESVRISLDDVKQSSERLKNWIGKRVLAIHNIDELSDSQSTLRLFPTELSDSNLCAISHRWNVATRNRHRKIVNCEIIIKDDQTGQTVTYHWDAVIQDGCFQWIRELGKENRDRVVWMDQICIPQNSTDFKNSQITFMGQLYSDATTVICGYNCAEVGEDSESVKEYFHNYFERAWTQQEFMFGKVIFHPFLMDKLNIDDTLQIIKRTFLFSEEYDSFFDGVIHQLKGYAWIRSTEQVRYEHLLKHCREDYSQESLHLLNHLWELGWDRFAARQEKKREILSHLLQFRSICEWKGQNMLNFRILNLMCIVHCEYAKDQLYGVFGVVYYHRTGRLLDYSDVEGSYLNVLRMFEWPAMILNRNQDNDATGSDGYLTPLSWRCEGKNWHPYEVPKYSQGKVIARIAKEEFNKLHNPYHHVCLLNEDILIWIFQRNGRDWIALAKDSYERVGKVILSVEKNLGYWEEERVQWDIMNLLGVRLEIEDNVMVPNNERNICHWRFSRQIMQLKDYWLNEIRSGSFYENVGDLWKL
eukprot:gene4742-5088_t